MGTTNSTNYAKWNLFAGVLTRCMDQEVMNTKIFSRLESQELGTRRIPEEAARSELEATERDARHASFDQNHQFHIAVREYQR